MVCFAGGDTSGQGKSRQIKVNQGKSRQIKVNQGKSRESSEISGIRITSNTDMDLMGDGGSVGSQGKRAAAMAWGRPRWSSVPVSLWR